MAVKRETFSLKRLLRVWFLLAKMSAQDQLTTSWGGFIFLFGKIFRFLFFFLFLYSVLSQSKGLAGLSQEQVILFFLIFNLIDTVTQFLFRGVYDFRWRIIKGDFDLDLVKPLPSFFPAVFGWADILDFLTLIPLTGLIVSYILRHQLAPSLVNWFLFLLLFLNGVLITFAIHLLVCAVGVMTTEVDHLIWLWRDFSNLARVPTDIYSRGIRWFLTFIIPIVIIVTLPTKFLLGFFSWRSLISGFIIGAVSIFFSLKFWYFALRHYNSASS